MGTSRTSPRRPASTTSATRRARCFSTTTATACSISIVSNVGRYTTDVKGRGGDYVGLPDAFEGHLHRDRSEHSMLYRNLGDNRFKDVTTEVGLGQAAGAATPASPTSTATAGPISTCSTCRGTNHFYENEGGQRFVDKTAQYFPKTSWGAMGIKFFDYDNDGRPDLLVTDMHSDMSKEVGPDEEKKKSGMQWTGAFLRGPPSHSSSATRSITTWAAASSRRSRIAMGVENYWPWGPSIGDFNADGWQECSSRLP